MILFLKIILVLNLTAFTLFYVVWVVLKLRHATHREVEYSLEVFKKTIQHKLIIEKAKKYNKVKKLAYSACAAVCDKEVRENILKKLTEV